MSFAWRSGWPPAVATISGCDDVLTSLRRALLRNLQVGNADQVTILRARINDMLDARCDLRDLEVERIRAVWDGSWGGAEPGWPDSPGRITGRVGAS